MTTKRRKKSSFFKTRIGALTLFLGALIFFMGDLFTGIAKDVLDLFLPPNQSLGVRIFLFIVMLMIFGYLYSRVVDAERAKK